LWTKAAAPTLLGEKTMCYAETKAELRMKEAIKTYEKETGIAVAGFAFLEAQFEYLRMI